MVQPIMTSLGRNAKILSSGNRVISETFKDNKGATTVVIKVFDSNDRVLKTKMKRIYETILKNGKRILTREDEMHVQEKIAGTETPKMGPSFTNKLFKIRERLFSKDNKFLFERKVTYEKPAGCSEYINKKKVLTAENLFSTTSYRANEKPEDAIREMRLYEGRDVLKLPYNILTYNDNGIPFRNNNFDLKEFEIFNK